MARIAGLAGAELLKEVEKLARDGYGKGEIAQQLGFTNPTTFSGRLVKASQQTGKSIPAFKRRSKAPSKKRVEVVPVKRRGKGDAYAVNIPQEPLERLGVNVGRRRILLTPTHEKENGQAGPKPPRLIRKRGNGSMGRPTGG